MQRGAEPFRKLWRIVVRPKMNEKYARLNLGARKGHASPSPNTAADHPIRWWIFLASIFYPDSDARVH
jgi:hypothetical protein